MLRLGFALLLLVAVPDAAAQAAPPGLPLPPGTVVRLTWAGAARG